MEREQRKPTRLEEYDYSSPGAYFITVCTDRRRQILSQIVGGGVLDAPRVELSVYGKIVERRISVMNGIYQDVKVDKYVIMPNHIHLILRVTGGSSGTPTPTCSRVSSFISTLKRMTNKEIGQNVWQRSFYDHVIRGDRDYLAHLEYVEQNPAKWAEDEYNE